MTMGSVPADNLIIKFLQSNSTKTYERHLVSKEDN